MTNEPRNPSANAAERRRLWREWIHVDVPEVERRHAAAARRAATPRDAGWMDRVIVAPPGVIEGLSAAVRDSLVGAELPASDRARLLRRAERLGLNRFEANLLIAAVQHRARSSAGETTPRFVAVIPPERSFGVAKLVACAVAVETIVAAVAIHLFVR